MNYFGRIACLLVTLCCICDSASADIVLTAGTATFQINSGVKSVDILVRSNAADTSLFLIADFELAAGVFPTTAGEFGQAGMLGVGNIQFPPASQFVSTGDNKATLSLDFTNPQLFPDVDTVLARMFIDTTGLAIGTYEIRVTSSATEVTTSTVNGSFTIAAVPEPGSLCFLGVASLCLLGRYRALNSNRKRNR
jgi:hypothetical protein